MNNLKAIYNNLKSNNRSSNIELVFQRAKSVKRKNVQHVILNVDQQLEHSLKYVHS